MFISACLIALTLWCWVYFKDPTIEYVHFLDGKTATNTGFKIQVDKTRTTWPVFAQEYYESKWVWLPQNMIKTMLSPWVKKFKSERNLRGAALTHWIDPEQASLETLQTVYGYTWLTEKDWKKAIVEMAQYDTSNARRLWERLDLE